jgi:hypothetical protein
MSKTPVDALMPIRFNALVLETTNRCNAKCGMCYQSSGPKGHDSWGMHSLNVRRLVEVITEAIKIPNLEPRLHIAGGEAFLKEKDVYELVAAGQKAGFVDITLTTNAFWGTSAERANEICKVLADKGVTALEISWDFWHLDYIKPQCINRVLEAALRFNISTNLRILTTKSHSVQEALGFLRDGLKYTSVITHGPVLRSGRAVTSIEESDFFRKGVGESDRCHAALNLALNSTGDVFPCCAGIDQTQHLGLGNIKKEDIVSIAREMSSNLWIKKLVFGGILPLERIVSEKRKNELKVDEEDSMCSRCWSLFKDKENAEIVREYGETIRSKVVSEIKNRIAASRVDVF